MKVLLPAALVLAASGAVVQAAEEPKFDYTCRIEAKRTGGWTPYQIKFSINEEDMTVLVDHGMSTPGEEGPVTAKFKRRDDETLRFKWRIGLRTSEWDIMSIGYRVDFKPETKTGMMWLAIPSGGARDGPGTLSCK
ncbi:hypothetical protein [Pseudophaeobacter arcticus]|uniref:hypothetical protein n=1 Tax=Pseudophaeobacter arcticus TaxID=385492 RepID=UPI003A97394C